MTANLELIAARF